MTFEKWLQRAGYRESTVRMTVRQVDAARRALSADRAPGGYLGGAIRRYLAWARAEGLQGPDLDRFEALGYEPVSPATGPRKARKLPRRSFTDEDWFELLQALAADDCPESDVLQLMAVTGLRVGDVLAVPWRYIDEGIAAGQVTLERKGGEYVHVPTEGSEPEWLALRDKMDAAGRRKDIVASYVRGERHSSPLAGDAAYQRVNRYLKTVGLELGLPAPVHLHRLRRTTAVQALRMTKDMSLVQQLLGHRSMSSTERYVDELRSDDVGRLQRKLGKYRKGR